MDYIAAALTLVAGMAWNDAIKTTLDRYFSEGRETILGRYVYAIIVTIISVLLIYMISRVKDTAKILMPDKMRQILYSD